MKRLIPIIIILLATCGAARAELTQEAKDEIGQQLTALHDVAGTFEHGFSDMRKFPERIPDYRSMFAALGIDSGGTAIQSHFRGLIWLMDGNGQGHTPDGRNILATRTREEIIARGLSVFAGASSQYQSTINKLNVMIASYPECSSSCKAKTILSIVEKAFEKYNAWNPDHDWTEPRLDANVAFSLASGSTNIRETSAVAGPHGDYRVWLSRSKSIQQYLQHAMYQLVRAAANANDATRSNLLSTKSVNMFTAIFKLNFVQTGLAIGWEHPSVAGDIETMFAQGSTSRGREFFQVTIAIQLATNVNRGGDRINGFGLVEAPGMAGKLASLRSVYESALQSADGDQATVNIIARSMEHLWDGWGLVDGMSWDGLTKFLLKNPPRGVEIVVDNRDPNTDFTGNFDSVSSASGHWEQDSFYDNADDTFSWFPSAPTGSYEVYIWYTWHRNRSKTVPYRVHHAGGIAEHVVNQNDASQSSRWVLLAVYDLNDSSFVEVSSENGQASADAVRVVEVQ